jgi:hypothetical protein
VTWGQISLSLAILHLWLAASEGEASGRAHNVKFEKPFNATKKVIQPSNRADEVLLIDSKRREKLLKSKKKLLKFRDHGSHMHFGDDDVLHEAGYYQRKEKFAKKGRLEEQREAFIEAEWQRTEVADLEDKEPARRKRREKEKGKAREREPNNAEGEGERITMLVPYEGDGLGDEVGEGSWRSQRRGRRSGSRMPRLETKKIKLAITSGRGITCGVKMKQNPRRWQTFSGFWAQ